MGPLWIVMGLIPGRPLGFEKWLRIVFTNLAIFPLVAFILVFARVIIDAIPKADPSTVFVPPLIGNPNVSTFAAFMGFGALLIAPSIPDLIRDRMKAKGQTNYGAIAAGGITAGAAIMSSPGKRVWEGLNRKNPTTQEPEGPLAVMKQRMWEKTPLGRRAIARKSLVRNATSTGRPLPTASEIRARAAQLKEDKQKPENRQAARAVRAENPSLAARAAKGTGRAAGRVVGRVFGRGGQQGQGPIPPQAGTPNVNTTTGATAGQPTPPKGPGMHPSGSGAEQTPPQRPAGFGTTSAASATPQEYPSERGQSSRWFRRSGSTEKPGRIRSAFRKLREAGIPRQTGNPDQPKGESKGNGGK